MNYKKLLKAMSLIENDRKISQEVVVEALKEALAKAYRKHVDIPDLLVRVDITKKGEIIVYQQYKVVEEVDDDEFEISLVDAQKQDSTIELDDLVEHEVSIENLGRASAVLAKNVMKQKIREAEKQAVYDEYIDLLDEMVIGTVESVEEKFALVNLDKTIALMPQSAQVAGEKYYEGQKLRVIISDVRRETKGSQVIVSRADAKLVKRLFEKEVPEIYQGTVEIKAIAREAGERTKMAVYSTNSDVDAIGACIGPRGSRVQDIIDELNGEKIDIFEWSSDIEDLVSNALAPAEVTAVILSEDKRSLIVVVDENQLSLAIGKKGKNARLAVKLTNMKIDIKTRADLEANGVDYELMLAEYQAKKQLKQQEEEAKKSFIENTVVATIDDQLTEETETLEQPKVEEEVIAEEVINSTEDQVEEVNQEQLVEEKVEQEEEIAAHHPLRSRKERQEYVSKFEKILDHKDKANEGTKYKKRKKKEDDEDIKLRSADIRKDKDYDIKPVYSEDELEEIRLREELEAQEAYSIDYDEYEEFYSDDFEE